MACGGYVSCVSDARDGRGREGSALPTFLALGLAGREPQERTDLAAEEAAHLRAARIRPGGRFAVTDGAGRRWEAELVAIGRREARCRLVRPLSSLPPLPLRVWAPIAHRDRSLWLVEKVVELGAAAVTWIEWDRSRSVGDAGRSEGFHRRAAGRARAAVAQAGRSWLPRLHGPVSPGAALAAHDGPGWLADARGRSPLVDGSTHDPSRPRPGSALTVAVGPEGGLTPGERRRCVRAGFELVSLGPGTLRFETAAVAVTALAAAILANRGETR